MEENTERPSYEPELTEPPTPVDGERTNTVPLQRLWHDFHFTRRTLQRIGIKPSWVLIIIISLVLAFAAQSLIAGHVDTEATIRARLADRGRR